MCEVREVSVEAAARLAWAGLPWLEQGAGRCTRAVVGRRGGRRRWDKPIERLVPVSCTGCPASTSGLSTWWSTTALGETWF